MNVYIDLEATQFGKEIISFGAVTNTGREFYSLVNPKHLNKVTPFITRLTGLTKEMFDESVPDICNVIIDFWNWCNLEGDSEIYIFSYGGFDRELIAAEASRYPIITVFQEVLNRLNNLEDVCSILLFNSPNTHSLVSSYERVTGVHIKQSHNALEDAIMLKDIHNFLLTIENVIDLFIVYEENYLLNKYIKRYRRNKGTNKGLKKFLDSLSDIEIENLNFKDIEPFVGYSNVISRVKEDYKKLMGKFLKGKIYV